MLDRNGKSIAASTTDEHLYTLLVDVKPGSELEAKLNSIELKLDAVLKALERQNGGSTRANS